MARLESKSFAFTQCMEFYYYLFAPGTKYKFNIYIKVNNQIGLPIWSRESSNYDFWRSARVTVTSGNSYSVVFEITGIQSGTTSDKFALDDIYFTDNACQDSIAINGICTFSDGQLCGYTVNSTQVNYKWTVSNPQLGLQQGPLPIFDHTSEGIGSGYLYAQSTSGLRLNETTSLISQVYPPLDPITPNMSTRCLEFYYYIQKTEAISLNVFAVIPPSSINLIWSRNYEHTGFWWKANVQMQMLVNHYYMIQATVGSDPNNGVVAIDDVGLRNGACSRYLLLKQMEQNME